MASDNESTQQELSRLHRGGKVHPNCGRKTIPTKEWAANEAKKFFVDDEASESDASGSGDEGEENTDEEMKDFVVPDSEVYESDSSSEDSDEKTKAWELKGKKSLKRPRQEFENKGDLVADDTRKVAPAAIVSFLQARQTHRACGRCNECKKPPCGTCKQCLQNQKGTAKADGHRDKRRCEMLRCKKYPNDVDIPIAPGIPTDKDEISKLLQKVSSQLAEVSAHRGTPNFDETEYDGLVEKMRQLHDGLTAIKSRKNKSKAKFPLCFHDAFGVVSELEKKRLRFAKFVVRAGSSDDCRTLADKREMRDDLQELITLWCAKRAKNLKPTDDKTTYDSMLKLNERV